MNNALELIYYILEKIINFMFTTTLFSGVSLGFLFISFGIINILVNFVLSVPKHADYHERRQPKNEKSN